MSATQRALLLALGLGLLGPTGIGAQTVNDAAGLAVPLDQAQAPARAAAMGSAFVAVADDASALLWNPAGLGGLSDGEVSFHHQSWIAGTRLENLLLALPLGRAGALGLSARTIDYGTFGGRSSSGDVTPDYSAQWFGLGGGWGKKWGKFSAGLGLEASQQNLGGKAYTSFSSDGGVLLETLPGLTLGAAFTRMGKATAGPEPSAFQMGAAWRKDFRRGWNLLLACSGSLERSGLNGFQAGTEMVYKDRYALRVGYQFSGTDNQVQGLQGLTAGAGYRWRSLALDYAFVPYGDLGNSQRLSLTYRFQGGKTPGDAGTASATPAATPSSPASGESTSPTGSESTAVETTPTPSGTPSVGTPMTDAAPAPSDEGDSDNLEILFKLPPDTLRQGRELEAQGKVDEAIDLYNRAIEKDHKNLLAWWGLGNIYVRSGRKAYAVPCFEKVLEIKPDAQKLREWLDRYKASKP